MKNPRESLFARHQAAIPKLDAIRRQVVAASQCAGPEPLSGSLAEWCREFFRIPRMAWAGLLATWAIILALHVAAGDGTSAPAGTARQTARRSPELLQALREQRELFTELVGSSPAPEPKPSDHVPRPRSASELPTVGA